MRIAVIGAGIVGVTSAYELAAAGHEVTVFEQGGSVAAEASFAHAGLDGPGSAVAWSPLSVTGSLLGLALRGRLPAALALSARPATCAWTLRWLSANRASAQALLRQRLHHLASYSRERAVELTRVLHLEFERSNGVLIVSRNATEAQSVQPALAALDELGVRFHQLSPEQCLSVEPGLNPDARLHSGVHLPDEGASNCREFAHLMRQQAQRHGTRFVFNAKVLAIHPGTLPELTVSLEDTASGVRQVRERFDAVLVCAALGSCRLLSPLGVKLPMIGVHGHSVTAPLRLDEVHPHVGPNSVLLDPRNRVAINRAGTRVRVSGGPLVGRMSRSSTATALRQLYQALDEWFPGASRVGQARHWQAASPTLPDGLPVIGPSGVDGVWLNLGHSSVGWTLSCGSAQVLTAMMGGVPADIDTEGLGAERFR
ncbi:MAG: FAD-dependent oxidoreductase [Burkholderiaceae bacterium]|nr:FAD-dependent oxidoreductase [Burkholderiaceae bacterium]